MMSYKKGLFRTVLLFISFSTLFAQSDEELSLLLNLDLGLPPSGLNVDRSGSIISSIGDINGDGYDDWAIGTARSAEYLLGLQTGAVHIYFGSATRRSSETPADLVLRGELMSGFGTSVKGVGDVNADGFDDFLVNFFDWDDTFTSATSTWALYYGGSPLDLEADILLTKSDSHPGYPNFASGAGDVNGDGYDDVVLSVPTNIWGLDTAHVYLFNGGENMDNTPDLILAGPVNPPSHPHRPGAQNFTGATSAGDMNNDGFDDLIISSSYGALLYYGGTDMDNVSDLLFDNFTDAGIGTGPGVGAAGDLNNDGIDDIWLTANTGSSKTFICFGGAVVDNIPDVVIPIWTDEVQIGFSAAGAGDVNKDGIDDLLLGTKTQWSIASGQARLFFGAAQMDSIADVIVFGPQPGANFGYSCAGGGDFDGDGYRDFLVGEEGATANFVQQDDAGSISLFYGGESISENADALFSGVADNEGFGSSVANAGDVNGDGYVDLLVGASSHWDGTHYAGRAYLYLGSEELDAMPDIIFDPEPDNGKRFFGKVVRTAGDINGDGFSDIYIEEETKISIYLGGSPMDNVADYAFDVPKNGFSFSAIGDVNKDGKDDILYGDPASGSGGTAWLYLGGDNLLDGPDVTYNGKASGDNMGSKVCSAGDLNDDGFMDFLISVPGDDTHGSNAGSVMMLYGSSDISNVLYLDLPGHHNNQGFGARGITGGGDINGDGYNDVAIGDNFFSLSSSSNEGRIYIYYGGSVIESLPAATITGNSAGLYLGQNLMMIPDLNEDGFDELMTNEGYYTNQDEVVAIYHGGNPIDSIHDFTLPFSFPHNDFGTYLDDEDNAVYLIVGDQGNPAAGPGSGRVSIYSNLPEYNDTTTTANTRIKGDAHSLHHKNFPNPFAQSTIIVYQLPLDTYVELSIYNMLGQKISTLVSRQQPAGYHEESFDAGDLPGGIYLYHIRAGNRVDVGKMSLKRK